MDEGQVKIRGHKWKVSKALSGEWVHLVAMEGRYLVFYCSTLIREIDPGIQCSTIVEHWIPSTDHQTNL